MTISVILMSSSAQTCSRCPLTPPSISPERHQHRAADHHAFHEDAKPGDLTGQLANQGCTNRLKSKSARGYTLLAYCVKCKAKRQMQDGEKVTMKNGRPAMKGKCPECGTGLYRILKA